MATTGLVAELIVVGLQALLWISVLLIGIFGHEDVFGFYSALASTGAVFAVILLAAAYTIGVVVDRIFLVAVLGLGIEKFFCEGKWFRTRAQPRMNEQFLRVYQVTNNLDTFYYYVMRRTRITCATAMNMAFLAISIAAAYVMKPQALSSPWYFAGLFSSVALFSLASFLAYGTLAFTMVYRGQQILELAESSVGGGKKND